MRHQLGHGYPRGTHCALVLIIVLGTACAEEDPGSSEDYSAALGYGEPCLETDDQVLAPVTYDTDEELEARGCHWTIRIFPVSQVCGREPHDSRVSVTEYLRGDCGSDPFCVDCTGHPEIQLIESEPPLAPCDFEGCDWRDACDPSSQDCRLATALAGQCWDCP